MKPDVVAAGSIAIFKNALPDHLAIVKNFLESAEWQQALVTVSDPEKNNHYSDAHIEESKKAEIISAQPELEDILDNALHAALDWYKDFFQCEYVEGPEGYAVFKYPTGGYYQLHADFTPENRRVVSAVFYINGDYKGGELYFPGFDYTVVPEPGMLVLFPSNYAYAHVANPVSSGIKYSVATWCK